MEDGSLQICFTLPHEPFYTEALRGGMLYWLTEGDTELRQRNLLTGEETVLAESDLLRDASVWRIWEGAV